MNPRPGPRVVEDLKALLTLGESRRGRLLDRLSDGQIGLYPFTKVADVVKEVSDGSELTPTQVESLGGALGQVGFALASSSEPLPEALKKLKEVFAKRLDASDLEVIGSFLQSYVGIADLMTSFKATSLYEDGESVVLNSRILVDLRPVFDLLNSEEVSASALLYRMRVTYRAPNERDNKTIVLTLHEQELKELEEAVKRAGIKASTLRRKLGSEVLGTILEDRT